MVFFDEWLRFAGGGSIRAITKRVREAGVVENTLSPAFAQLAMSLKRSCVTGARAKRIGTSSAPTPSERRRSPTTPMLIVDAGDTGVRVLGGGEAWSGALARTSRVTIAGSPGGCRTGAAGEAVYGRSFGDAYERDADYGREGRR